MGFVARNSKITRERYLELMKNVGELATDIGCILNGEEAVAEGLVSSLGGIADAFEALYEMIEHDGQGKASARQAKGAPKRASAAPQETAPPALSLIHICVEQQVGHIAAAAVCIRNADALRRGNRDAGRIVQRQQPVLPVLREGVHGVDGSLLMHRINRDVGIKILSRHDRPVLHGVALRERDALAVAGQRRHNAAHPPGRILSRLRQLDKLVHGAVLPLSLIHI